MKTRNSKGQFIKGYPHNKGVERNELFKLKLKKANLGKKMSNETKKKISISVKKYIHTKEHNKKVSLSKIGNKNFNFGKKLSIETRRKMSENKKGSKSYLWKGGITPINNSIRKSLEYKLWREAVFRRDNWTCIWCGFKGYVEADHIKPFAHYPELRFTTDNGRTLCIPCHKLRHKIRK